MEQKQMLTLNTTYISEHAENLWFLTASILCYALSTDLRPVDRDVGSLVGATIDRSRNSRLMAFTIT